MASWPYTLWHCAGRAEASLKALLQLRGSKEAAEKEQKEINESVNSRSGEEEVSVMELMQPPNFWPVSVAVGLMVAQQTTGITAVVFFASTILEVGGEALAAMASVLMGVINLLGNVIGIYCVATVKRRDCLLWSTYGVVASLLVLTAFFWAREAGGAALELANRYCTLPSWMVYVDWLSYEGYDRMADEREFINSLASRDKDKQNRKLMNGMEVANRYCTLAS